MIASLIIGKDKSTGLPGKNYMDILGRPLVEYAFMKIGSLLNIPPSSVIHQ